MNKKLLVGSIIAVAVLIGISFTSVVGYSSVKSNVKASPLFTIRTQRAIDEESKDLTCDYVGKGEECFLSIPKRDNKTELIIKVIDALRKMDNKEFNLLKNRVIYFLFEENKIKSRVNIIEIDKILNKLRNDEDGKLYDYIIQENDPPTGLNCPMSTHLFCWIALVLALLLIAVQTIPYIIFIQLILYLGHLCSVFKIKTFG
ncbi:MAG: hypothetical protein JSW60_08480 [Thermoplasmatales archaeon]|nr:MAG: hypothetical protein JSW60_08480 [Thermoplasmatales archaeon]